MRLASPGFRARASRPQIARSDEHSEKNAKSNARTIESRNYRVFPKFCGPEEKCRLVSAPNTAARAGFREHRPERQSDGKDRLAEPACPVWPVPPRRIGSAERESGSCEAGIRNARGCPVPVSGSRPWD